MKRHAASAPFHPSPEYGQYSTNLAYALTELGQPHTPEQVDAIIGRRLGEPCSYREMVNGDLYVMEQGHQVTLVNWEGHGVDADDYLDPKADVSYEDFIAKLTEVCGAREAARWTPQRFLADKEQYAQAQGRLEGYRSSGLFVERTLSAESGGLVLPGLFSVDRKVVVLADMLPAGNEHPEYTWPIAISASTAKETTFFMPDNDGGEVLTRQTPFFENSLLLKGAGMSAITGAKL